MFKAELRAAEVYTIFKKSVFAVFDKNNTPIISEIELANLNHFFPKTMGRSDLSGPAQFRKLWECCLF